MYEQCLRKNAADLSVGMAGATDAALHHLAMTEDDRAEVGILHSFVS